MMPMGLKLKEKREKIKVQTYQILILCKQKKKSLNSSPFRIDDKMTKQHAVITILVVFLQVISKIIL